MSVQLRVQSLESTGLHSRPSGPLHPLSRVCTCGRTRLRADAPIAFLHTDPLSPAFHVVCHPPLLLGSALTCLPRRTTLTASSGIGLAAAKGLARHGLNVFMVDVAQSLNASAEEVKKVDGAGDVVPVHCDVSNIEDVVKLREQVLDTYGECHVLLNNAGISRPTPAFSLDRDLKDLQADWAAVLGTNMNGIINVAQAFAPFMSRQENESVIINTGSKQGITCPPGRAGYNVSKAAVKVFTEQRGFCYP